MNVDASQLVDSSSSLQYFFRTYWLEAGNAITDAHSQFAFLNDSGILLRYGTRERAWLLGAVIRTWYCHCTSTRKYSSREPAPPRTVRFSMTQWSGTVQRGAYSSITETRTQHSAILPCEHIYFHLPCPFVPSSIARRGQVPFHHQSLHQFFRPLLVSNVRVGYEY
jgi:hypothetical protein